jgi:E3 ubiquitin-protein ligase SIAH1
MLANFSSALKRTTTRRKKRGGAEASTRFEERGQDQRAEVAEEPVRSGGAQGGNGGGGGGEQAVRMDSESLFMMDLHVLDCTVCCQPLRPPIYQVITTATTHSSCCIYSVY